MSVIYCFSATGNSLYVAKQIGEVIGATIEPMKETNKQCDDAIIGFVFPVYFWSLPYKVEEFIKGLEIKSQNPYIFAVATYGGDVVGVFGLVEQLLAYKGHHLQYAKAIKAVENYIPALKVNDVVKVENNLQTKLAKVCQDIKNKESSKFASYTFINKIIRNFFPAKSKKCDEHFTVNSKCIGCSICSKVCPVDNISLVNQRPEFAHQCEHCLACIHACPQVAIEWKKGTIDKNRFRNQHISLKELTNFNDNLKLIDHR